MAVTIQDVEQYSIAQQYGIAPGHRLVRIGENEINDVLDYRFYSTEPQLNLVLESPQGQVYTKSVRKGRYADLGLVFDTYLMDKQRFCKNKCVFCFIDQLPKGLRESLYFKDDDSRMSFLFGNYITLTNLEEKDIDRIIKMRISPVNVSVHTTNPDLRVQMMGNPRSGEVLAYIDRLVKAGIQVNAQLVLCPGFNDGPELERSLQDLAQYTPLLQSVAVVPVGLTKFREKLPQLRLFTQQEAAAVIHAVHTAGDQMLAKTGRRIFYAADELYLAAGNPLPEASFYEEYPQLENGVGMLALLLDEFFSALEDAHCSLVHRRVSIATGKAAYPFISDLFQAACNKFPGLTGTVYCIPNLFFGETITVAGLITGEDILARLKGKDLGDALLIPSAMLRHEGDLFLDSMELTQLAKQLGVPVLPVENAGQSLLEALLGTGCSRSNIPDFTQ